jgi:SNARE protein
MAVHAAWRRLLKDFEREARTDGMPAPILAERKKELADGLNELISRKKDITNAVQKEDLFAGAAQPEETNVEGESASTSAGGACSHPKAPCLCLTT